MTSYKYYISFHYTHPSGVLGAAAAVVTTDTKLDDQEPIAAMERHLIKMRGVTGCTIMFFTLLQTIEQPEKDEVTVGPF